MEHRHPHPEPPAPRSPGTPQPGVRAVRSMPRPWVIGLAAGALVLLAGVVSVAGVRHTARLAIGHEVRDNLGRLAVAVAASIDTEAHAALLRPDQENTDAYQGLNRPLTRVIARTDGVRFVYTLRPVGDELHFVLDGTPPGDADADGVEDHSSLMDRYEDPDPAAWEAFRSGRFTVTAEPYTDQWGTFLSGFAPIRFSDGTIDGVVGVDLGVGEYHSRLAGVDRAAMLALIPGAVMAGLVGLAAWWVSARVTRQAAEAEAHRLAAERANRAKSTLLANISHELRTPLTAVMGFVEIAVDPSVSDGERGEAVSTVRHSADHLLTLINDLLDMAKLDADAIEIEPVEVDIRELVRTAVAPLRMKAAEKSVTLEVVGLETMPARVWVDPTRTRQILLNLLSNAVKFTDTGGVRLVLACDAGGLRLRVEDTGPGIDAAQVALLFQPFSQVGGAGGKRHEGTGLGLAISQHLAGLMGGVITVESELGVGSAFTAVIPCRVSEGVGSGGVVREMGVGPLAGRRVLVAEDGADNRRLLRFILTRAGAEVEEHADGQAALEAMLKPGARVDLVLTDWDMPRLDGAGLVAALRAVGWSGPVVSLTAHAMGEQERACLEAGCDAHLTKPIDWGMLVDTCAGLIGGQGKMAA